MAAAPDTVRTDGVVLVGHSAGGQLALWAAARHRMNSAVRGVVALAPVSSLSRADREGVGDGAVADLLGGHADEVPDRYAAADPTALVPSGLRTVIVHGPRDEWVPVEHSRSYLTHARAAGDDVTLVEPPGAAHFAVIDPLSSAWSAVLAAVRELSAPASC